mgnify:CR=1 FL=1
MREKVKEIVKSNVLLNKWARKLQRILLIFRKTIIGNDNIIVNNGYCHKVKYDIVGNSNKIEIGKNSTLNNTTIHIRGNGHFLKIGQNCSYGGGSLRFEDDNCKIIIGDNTSVGSAHISATEPDKSIIIGSDCLFSYNIELRTGDSHSIIDLHTEKRINYAQDIVIGNHVWIGALSIILKGVEIGSNSIIGTNSLVTSNISPNSLAVGVPARVVKDSVDWKVERIYE